MSSRRLKCISILDMHHNPNSRLSTNPRVAVLEWRRLRLSKCIRDCRHLSPGGPGDSVPRSASSKHLHWQANHCIPRQPVYSSENSDFLKGSLFWAKKLFPQNWNPLAQISFFEPQRTKQVSSCLITLQILFEWNHHVLVCKFFFLELLSSWILEKRIEMRSLKSNLVWNPLRCLPWLKCLL